MADDVLLQATPTGDRGGGAGRRLSSAVGVLARDVAAGRAGSHRHRRLEFHLQLERVHDRAESDIAIECNRASRCGKVCERLRGAALADGCGIHSGHNPGAALDVLRPTLHRPRPDTGFGEMNACPFRTRPPNACDRAATTQRVVFGG